MQIASKALGASGTVLSLLYAVVFACAGWGESFCWFVGSGYFLESVLGYFGWMGVERIPRCAGRLFLIGGALGILGWVPWGITYLRLEPSLILHCALGVLPSAFLFLGGVMGLLPRDA